MDHPLMQELILSGEMNERFYAMLEETLPCPEHSDEMITAMNLAMGFDVDPASEHHKDRSYRPYCGQKPDIRPNMPRMFRVAEGFRCWKCHNIWDIASTLASPA